MSAPGGVLQPLDDRSVFVVWGPRRGSHRAELLGLALDVDVVRIGADASPGRRHAPARYVRQTLSTQQALDDASPEIVFVQSPPVFAVLAVWWWCRRHRARYVIDAHSTSLIASVWRWATPLSRALARGAVTTLLPTPALAPTLAAWEAPHDPLAGAPCTLYPNAPPRHLGPGPHVAVVTNPAPDEPLEAMLAAASALPEVTFHVTGDWTREARPRALLPTAPPNVEFTGYLHDDLFYGLLAAADVVVALTTQDATFQSAASEALWLGTPLVTSPWPHLQEYFTEGTEFAEPDADSIAAAIGRVLADPAAHRAGIARLQNMRRQDWLAQAENLRNRLEPS